MSTDLETRLSAALHARADLVTPDSLPPLEVPDAPVVPLVRRPATWVFAAAACAALLTLPFVLRDAAERTEQPPSTQGPSPTTSTGPTELTGDLDGDGTDETVTIDEHGMLSVVLASSNSGTPLTADAGADGSTLFGLVSLDDSGADAVVADDRGTGRVFRVTADGLVQVEVVGGQFFYPFSHNEEGQTWWVAGDELLTAVDTGQPPIWQADDWTLNAGGKLDSTRLGEYCSGSPDPAPCGGGAGVVDQDGLQVGLFPESGVVPAGQSLPISIDGGGGPGTITLDGSTLTVDFPGGSPAQQVTIPGEGTNQLLSSFMPGGEVPGIVVRRTGADGYVVFTIVTWRSGELTVLDSGEQVSSWDDHRSWLSTNGRLFTMSPSVSADGASLQQWSMTETGVVAHDVTAPDGKRWICFGEGDPAPYDAC